MSDFDKDPEFVAGYNRGQFVMDVVVAMKRLRITSTALARRLKKSPQYISKILNEDEEADFTIESMSEIACALGYKLGVRLAGPGKVVAVIEAKKAKGK